MIAKKIQILLTILLFLIAENANCQNDFNYNRDFKIILEETKKTESNLNYLKLLNRFQKNDSTLTNYEVLALLIGFTDNTQYKPYKDINKEREIYKLNGNGEFDKALSEANSFLKTHPLNVKTIFEKAYSFHKMSNPDSAQFYALKGHRIFKAMYFSGNGKSKENPTFALGPADGQDYIRKFVGADIGLMGSGRDNNNNFIDILEAKFEDGQSVTLYFIIQHATDKMFEKGELENAIKSVEKGKKKKEKIN